MLKFFFLEIALCFLALSGSLFAIQQNSKAKHVRQGATSSSVAEQGGNIDPVTGYSFLRRGNPKGGSTNRSIVTNP